MSPKTARLTFTLPALRGAFGSWIYYSCLMPIRELGERTEYATSLHPTKDDELSRMIQRALEGHRANEIAVYLTHNEDRFFNSLVLAVYGGKPDWLEIGISGTATPRASLNELTQEARDSIGFLRLSGAEKLFAIDGQHRLSGIKHALAGDAPLADELVPVIFVGHANTQIGMRRTRRLFTTLNKTAVAVTKRDIIALDEDDVMAITARDLYETDNRFDEAFRVGRGPLHGLLEDDRTASGSAPQRRAFRFLPLPAHAGIPREARKPRPAVLRCAPAAVAGARRCRPGPPAVW